MNILLTSFSGQHITGSSGLKQEVELLCTSIQRNDVVDLSSCHSMQRTDGKGKRGKILSLGVKERKRGGCLKSVTLMLKGFT